MAVALKKERQAPRLSVNEFAHYMVSSDTARMGILRRAKYPQSAPLIRYRDARDAVCRYLTDRARSLNQLVSTESMLKQRSEDAAISAFWQEDARFSIEVLHAVQRMANQLGQFDFVASPRDQSKLIVGGVEISVWADLLVYGAAKGQEQIGAAVLRMTQDDAETESARERRRNMGVCVASLARMHIEQNIRSDRAPANRLCMSVDIQHGEIFIAPNANARRLNDIENACHFIAAAWPGI